MKKQFLLISALILFSFACGIQAQDEQNAQGAQQDFTIHNQTGVSIDQLFIAPTDSEDWGEDVLGVDVLENGQSCEIQFHPAEETCKWDIWIKDAEGNELEWNELNLCDISEITLYWQDGKAWAETK
jgi:hypothetical protein